MISLGDAVALTAGPPSWDGTGTDIGVVCGVYGGVTVRVRWTGDNPHVSREHIEDLTVVPNGIAQRICHLQARLNVVTAERDQFKNLYRSWT